MFEASLVESTPLLRSRNRWPAVISITAQSLLAASLITIPLLHPELIASHAAKLSFLAPPRPIPPPPPPQLLHITTVTDTTPSIAPPSPAPTIAATTSHSRLFTEAPQTDIAPEANLLGLRMGDSPGSTFTLASSGPSGPPITTIPASGTPGKTIGPARVSTGVSEGHLINPIQPIYPAIARAARQQGVVVIEAFISKTGQIESAHATSGPMMLQPAALDAVRQARYHPFLLNGQPTEVATTISINFHLGS